MSLPPVAKRFGAKASLVVMALSAGLASTACSEAPIGHEIVGQMASCQKSFAPATKESCRTLEDYGVYWKMLLKNDEYHKALLEKIDDVKITESNAAPTLAEVTVKFMKQPGSNINETGIYVYEQMLK